MNFDWNYYWLLPNVHWLALGCWRTVIFVWILTISDPLPLKFARVDHLHEWLKGRIWITEWQWPMIVFTKCSWVVEREGRGGDIEGENSSLPVPSLSSLTPLTPVSCPLKHFSLKISKMFAILDFSLLSTSQSSNSPMFHPVTTDKPTLFPWLHQMAQTAPFLRSPVKWLFNFQSMPAQNSHVGE